MTKREKLIERFLSMPSDFTYDELVSLLKVFGYQEKNKGKTSGSRVKFESNLSPIPILLHKPHGSPIIPEYILRRTIKRLRKDGLL